MPTDPPTPELARVLSGYGQILMLLDRWSESMVQCERAVAMAREVGARQAEGHALNTLGLDLAVAGRCAEGVGGARGRASRSPARSPTPTTSAGATSTWARRSATAATSAARHAVVREGIVATDEVGVAGTYGGFVRANGIAYAYELGDWAEADRLADGERRRCEARGVRSVATAWPAGCRCSSPRATRGPTRLEELRDACSKGFPSRRSSTGRFGSPSPKPACGAATRRRRSRRSSAGSDELERSRVAAVPPAAATASGCGPPPICRGRPGAARRAGEADGGRARATRSGRRSSRSSRTARAPTGGSASTRRRRGRDAPRPSATACGGSPAAGAWRDAAERWQARENPYLVAYCRWREAEALLGDGDRRRRPRRSSEAHRHRVAPRRRVRSRRPSRRLAARSRLDLAPTSRRATTGTATTPPDDPFGLTRRERDVLPLLVKGRTNRQIAEELFISENTAGVHVSNILGKMGASSRTEAAGIAARLGLVRDRRNDRARLLGIVGGTGRSRRSTTTAGSSRPGVGAGPTASYPRVIIDSVDGGRVIRLLGAG